MTQSFYELRIKYTLKEGGSLFVDYTTVGAVDKDSLNRSISFHRKKHQKAAKGDVEIQVKAVQIGNTYFD